jgi:PIN domain nuclease of toxin-antitoxin system
VWLWWTQGLKDRIPARVAELIDGPIGETAVSIATLWELAIKSNLGRIEAPSQLASASRRTLRQQGFELLDIDVTHVDLIAALPLHHRDPFDRMLIAQAQAEEMTIITVDRAFEAYDVDTIIF